MTRSVLLAIALACAAPAALAQVPSKLQPKQAFAPASSFAKPVALQQTPGVGVGRFRVTITGLVAVEQTWDDAMQRDGKDDEVFLLAEARLIQITDNVPSAITQRVVRSLVMGDTNGFQPEERIRAGRASEDGGIQSGDKIGTTGTRNGEPREDRIPLKVWEGDIYDDMSLMIVPTIWEWDGAPNGLEQLSRSFLGAIDFIGAGADSAGDLPSSHSRGVDQGYPFLKRYSEMLTVRDVVGAGEAQEQTVVGTQADRPIGMSRTVGNAWHFDPWVISLGPRAARDLAQHDSGNGPGVIVLHYEDGPALHGKYDLYLQVEQLP